MVSGVPSVHPRGHNRAHNSEQPETLKINSSAVAKELDRVLTSASFRRSPRLRALLEFSVATALESDSVTERMAARQLFQRGDDFNPLLDPTVRVQFGRLRKRLKSYFENEGANDSIHIRIPERCYTPLFEAACVPDPNGPVILPRAGASAAASAASPASDSAAPGKVSVAVLPFLNLTNDPSQDVFCYGLTDELISALATVPSVDVVARSSAFQFQSEPVDVRAVGRELGVEMVLEGSVKVDRERTRITAQLADVKDGFARWADAYDRESESGDSVSSQQAIAIRIVHALPLLPE